MVLIKNLMIQATRLFTNLVQRGFIWTDYRCCIFWPAFGCSAKTFSTFFVLKSWKMQKKKEFAAKFSKKMVFLGLHQRLVKGFIPKKHRGLVVFMCFRYSQFSLNFLNSARFYLAYIKRIIINNVTKRPTPHSPNQCHSGRPLS